jgi:hypothetical protein
VAGGIGGTFFGMFLWMAYYLTLRMTGTIKSFGDYTEDPPIQVMFWSPLIMILYLDGLRERSKAFHVALPSVYFVYVVTMYVLYGYVMTPMPIISRETVNSTQAGGQETFINASNFSFQGQIAAALQTILFLVSNFIFGEQPPPAFLHFASPIRYSHTCFV